MHVLVKESYIETWYFHFVKDKPEYNRHKRHLTYQTKHYMIYHWIFKNNLLFMFLINVFNIVISQIKWEMFPEELKRWWNKGVYNVHSSIILN